MIQLETGASMKLRSIKSKVNSPLKFTKLFQFQSSVFPTGFKDSCSLLQRSKFKYQFTQCTTDRTRLEVSSGTGWYSLCLTCDIEVNVSQSLCRDGIFYK